MNKYEQKPATGPAKPADTTQPNKTSFNRNDSGQQKAGEADEEVQQVTDKDVIKKPYAPNQKDSTKEPMRAAKGDDDVMSQPQKRS